MPDMFLLLFLIHAPIRQRKHHYSYFIKKVMEIQKDKKVIFSKLHVKSSPDPGFLSHVEAEKFPSSASPSPGTQMLTRHFLTTQYISPEGEDLRVSSSALGNYSPY